MRASFVPLLLAAAASASLMERQLSSLPTCALPCLVSANVGSCSQTDIACLCSSSSFVSSLATCIESSCTGADVQTAISQATALCANNGVTLSSEAIASVTSVAAASASASASASVTGTSTVSSAAASTSSSSSGTLSNGAHGALALIGAVAALAL
ncbi:hypothetical protein HETIRDRAFT_454825 [Heterobasidion irregulare TC 32-1]|uniref:CFEM domain-containing protein n=1 Tax=Heterobasidion irregulare (strain TC 32-1) TaxID=747525 RepID=W4JVG1_HETIT|nr:uncharacterized protein HETIRDRAFT_454825 [Heterobasidion irregulare TC 32-1]ETW77563.1 hypothetical protein HETIRDRAFT_454825 [Heterobasidion irregulare TC 32-1]